MKCEAQILNGRFNVIPREGVERQLALLSHLDINLQHRDPERGS